MNPHDVAHQRQANHRFSVGLTGGIGSGKTTVANMFAERGAAVIDTDAIAHQLTAADGIAIAPIRAEFGDAFITTSGAMDRAKMRAHVFSDPTAKQRLEAILHPLIRTETMHAAAQASGLYLLFVVPLLVESGTWKQRVDRILVVDCDEQVQIRRVMQRNALSEPQVRAIMATQASRQQRLQAADDIILNDSDPATLVPQVERLHALYASLNQP
ncbi:dephospho-CoA kinase [Paraherbaspirillum soli]|uniref:Dephospho-CoA kinase n=1 Tax=Paraherbaspirillum soli TaxID=631222 RepID=A0ABW0MEX1_9BURK